MSMNSSNTKGDNDDELMIVSQILSHAGLESAPIDPSSLEALQELVRQEQQAQQAQKLHEKKKNPSAVVPRSPPSPSFGAPEPKEHIMKEEPSFSSGKVLPREEPPPSPPSNHGEQNLSKDERILQQLHVQTKLILDLQQQIRSLSQKIDRLEKHPPSNSDRETLPQRNNKLDANQPDPIHNDNNYIDNYDDENFNNHLNPLRQQEPMVRQAPPRGLDERNQAQPQQPPEVAAAERLGFFGLLFWPLTTPVSYIWNSRIAEIVREFWRQSEGQVRPLDGGLLVKLLFMMLLTTARMQRRSKRGSDGGGINSYRFHITISLMITGFLYHTKYLQFAYKFFVEDQMPLRIWNGWPLQGPLPGREQQDNNNAIPNQGAHQQARNQPLANGEQIQLDGNNNNDADQELDWRFTFLGGIIIPRPDQNPLVAAVQDVFYLVGSFFFSIFPMWRPEAPPVPRAVQRQPPPPGGIHQNQNGNDPREIPNVAPPRDAMEALEEEDDDSDHEEEEIVFHPPEEDD